ncbi:tagatose kinase [Kineosporia babensis]|uniref:Sugar kinase n=1 Tax=Kineosporia babensis TaxID=499548 RepID=A0A9X1NB22_9ACTN|nr:sugar kinase [Kineosporia babensis]MCD5311927.1 sugar kinase [Kineosporia babensis]
MAATVLTIGEILVEIMATTPGEGFGEPQPLVGPFPSGAPAIFIDQVSRLGTPAAIVSRVGDDDFGRLNLNRLRADGVDVSGIEVAAGETTGSAFVRYRPDGSRAFVFNIAHSATGRLSLTPSAEALIERCDHLHIMGSALSAPGIAHLAREAVRRVKARGGSLSFDPNLRPEILQAPGLPEALDEVLAQCDVFLPSGEEIFLFTESKDEAAAVTELLQRGIGTVVIKRGNQGASRFDQHGRIDAAALTVDEVDPTGAGDCFAGAYVSFWLAGADPETTLRYANAAGAHAVTKLGPMEGAATLSGLNALLAAQNGKDPRGVWVRQTRVQ